MGRKDEAGAEAKPEWKIWRGSGLLCSCFLQPLVILQFSLASGLCIETHGEFGQLGLL